MRIKYILLLLFISSFVFGTKVDFKLLKESEASNIVFENYVGPHLFYNSIDEIRAIGSSLAQGIKIGEKSSSDYGGKYSMFHTPKLEWEELNRSCDIFEITERSLIDNIENVKLILSQYLIEKYNYTIDDADLLAELVVIYNAVYRGDFKHYMATYTSEGAILEDSSKLGIDTKYYNWPGKTFIYIPLTEEIIIGDLSTVDSDLFIEEEVISRIKDESEDSIQLREDIIEFKERQIDEDIKEVKEEKRELEKEKEVIEEKVKETLAREDIAEEEKKEVVEELIRKEDVIDARILELEMESKALRKSEDRVLEIRDDVAVDKNAEIVTKKSSGETFLFINKKKVGTTILGQFYLIDSSGDIVVQSDLNSVRGNSYIEKGDKLFVIAGGTESNHITSLASIDKRDLKLIDTSNIITVPDSQVILKGDSLYTIIESEGQYKIGEFNLDLELIKTSPLSVSEFSFIYISEDKIYIQGDDNSIKWVNLSDFISN